MDFHLKDRFEAGRLLAAKLSSYANRADVVVLALPRGGVPVAYEIARRINAPMDVFLVRKLGVPWQEELAMGAIASGGIRVINTELVHRLEISEEEIALVEATEKKELARRELAFRGDHPLPEMRGKIVILVDDGIATGMTVRAAIAALRQVSPARIIVATAVMPHDTYAELLAEADEVVCLATPKEFYALSLWYDDFRQETDEDVRRLLVLSWRKQPAPLAKNLAY